MTKRPVNPEWFQHLQTGNLKDCLRWLTPLSTQVDTIVSFGCCSSEPFALMWTLDAVEVKVVELNEDHLARARAELETLRRLSVVNTHRAFGCMEGHSIQFILGDMTRMDRLPSDHFDLAYCEDVLYDIHRHSGDLATVQSAVNEMTRVVKPGGWVIAVEPMIGMQEQELANDFLGRLSGRPMPHIVPAGEPIDISPLFEAAGLVKVSLDGAPKWSYCYNKPEARHELGSS